MLTCPQIWSLSTLVFLCRLQQITLAKIDARKRYSVEFRKGPERVENFW
jgi:hypothetical protein